ncbi:hypothetical protein [Lignipirellula cremea]|uniref:Uncharacterized protein n=1 Tax=Lignipirellula cremea TaxID=2528010 RepID=A0A518E0U9_9BACT|nr:hypothetical protein [Lignipirellula cremea]QDU97691.1 hypothetical protein Pla8534_55440 [Lignipirellula cremea]
MSENLQIALESVEWIVPLWLASMLGLGAMTIQLWRRLARRRGAFRIAQAWRTLHRSESGAAYSLGWVLTLPFYVTFLAFTLECALLLVAKTGSVYSAFAGARTAIVWQSIEAGGAGQTGQRARQAAQQAFVPFANGMQKKNGSSSSGTASARERAYLAANAQFSQKKASPGFLRAKYKDAVESLAVTTTGPAQFNDDIVCRVVFHYRFHAPLIGPLLGQRGADGEYYRDVISTVALQNEGPQNKNGRLGITFASR